MKLQRLGELDALRGIAALTVVLFHYTYFYNEVYGHVKENYFLSFEYGNYGVHLFFIISGFVIYMTILKSKTSREFLLKRAIRLYPAYLTAVTITFIVVMFFGLSDMNISFSDYLFNLTMFQGVVPGTGIDLVDGSYWSLAIEVTFYIFCAVLLTVGLIKKAQLITAIWLLGIFLIKTLYVNNLITPILGDLGIVNYSNLFIAGIMFYKLKNEGNSLISHGIVMFSLLYQFIYQGIVSGILVSVFFLIFYALINNKLGFLNRGSLVFLGSISYSLYLVHQNIGYIIINFLEVNGFVNEIFILVPILVSIGLAYLITEFIEKPIQHILLSKYHFQKSKRVPKKNIVA